MKYIPTYNLLTKAPSATQYNFDEASEMLNPLLPYNTIRIFYSNYDIKFDHQKCDLCITCNLLVQKFHNFPEGPEHWHHEDALLQHQAEAKLGVDAQCTQKEAAVASHRIKEVLQVDYIANPHTPFTNVSEACYKDKLGTYGYIITSIFQKPWSTIYMYGKTVALKGPMR